MATLITEDFEDTTYDITFTGTWARANDFSHGGTWSLKTPVTADNTSSTTTFTLPAGAKSLQFWFKVNTEPGFDYLIVNYGGSNQWGSGGTSTGWNLSPVFDVTNISSVDIKYTKDTNTAPASDACWIDDLVITDVAPNYPQIMSCEIGANPTGPFGYKDGDVLVALLQNASAAANITWPAEWTAIGPATNTGATGFAQLVIALADGNVSMPTASGSSGVVVFNVRGASEFYDAVAGTSASNVSPSVTSVKNNSLLISLLGTQSGAAITEPAGMIRRRASAANPDLFYGIADLVVASPSATGTKTWSSTTPTGVYSLILYPRPPTDFIRRTLTSGSSSVDAASYTTTSASPVANSICILSVSSGKVVGPADDISSVTGNGLAWTKVATILSPSTNQRSSIWQAIGDSPVPGTITINFGGIVQGNCAWRAVQYIGANAVLNSATGSGSSTPATATISPAPAASSTIHSFSTSNSTSGVVTPGTNFISVTQSTVTTPSIKLAVQNNNAGINPATFATGGAAWAIVNAEIGEVLARTGTGGNVGGSFQTIGPISYGTGD